MKGLRVAGARTLEELEEANGYLETEFLPWWNQHLLVAPATAVDSHRPLGPDCDLAATLSIVETRQVNNDYTIQFQGQFYRIASSSIMAGLRRAPVRVEKRLNGEICVRSRDHYLAVTVIGLGIPAKLNAHSGGNYL